MTIQDARKKKSELELECLALITKFEKETGTTVSKIDLTHARNLGGEHFTIQLEVEAKL